MRRVDILYNGTPYTVADSSAERFQAEVNAALVADVPQWLKVNHGEGRMNAALILVTRYSSLTIICNDFDDANIA